jgi:4-diphosphocytidyl-2-C-methyl-D-erythritol kinase
MVTFPNCKINIGLHITGKRPDGYHNLETIFYPIQIKDAIEIIETENENEVSFSFTGNNVNVSDDNNLCVKAYHLLKKDFSQIPSVKMHLHKNIPMGAGLGGGSADASAVLLLLDKKFNLLISKEKLIDYALQLGSDCPFFIINKPCFASGRGELLKEIEIDLSAYKTMIVNPSIHVSTADAFRGLDSNNFSPIGQLKHQIKQNIDTWKNCIKNDFEKPIFQKYPELLQIKNTLYENGAIYSAMSGSGSSVFGIFKKEISTNINFPAHYFCQTV